MIIESKAFGKIQINEQQKVVFPLGIYGFESLTDYVLMDSNQPPFFWLQSVKTKDIAFVLIEPRIIKPEYNPKIESQDLKELELNHINDKRLLQFAIVTIPADHRMMTANLQGPLIINKEIQLGRQCISGNAEYSVKHNILKELATVTHQNAC